MSLVIIQTGQWSHMAGHRELHSLDNNRKCMNLAFTGGMTWIVARFKDDGAVLKHKIAVSEFLR